MANKIKARSTLISKKRSRGARSDNYISTQESVGFVVREVYRMFARCLQARIARKGVTIGMWFVLRMLWDDDGMTQRELGERSESTGRPW